VNLRIPLLFLGLVFGLNNRAQAQMGLQQENVPSVLQAQGGLPVLKCAYGNLWGGYATLDTLATVHVGASNGFGIDNGRWFDAGATLRFNKLVLTTWTSGLTARLDQPKPTTSTLQRASNLGAQYRFRHLALYVGARVNYQSINASNTFVQIAPTLSAETEINRYRIGLRITNFSFSNTQEEGLIGDPSDSMLLSREVKRSLKGPSQALLTLGHFYPLGDFSLYPCVGLGLNFNTLKEYQRFGSNSLGFSTLTSLRLGYKKLFITAAYRSAQEAKLSQLSYGLSIRLTQLTLHYSSFNFYHFTAQRAHTVGLALNIK